MPGAHATTYKKGFYAPTIRRTLKVAGLFDPLAPVGSDPGFDAVIRFRLVVPATDINSEAALTSGVPTAVPPIPAQVAPGGEPIFNWLQVTDSATQGTSIGFLKRGIWHIQFGIGQRPATAAIAAAILWNGTTGVGGQTDAATTITAATRQYLSTEQLTVGTAGVGGVLMEAALPVSEWDLPRSNGLGNAAGKPLRFVATGISGTQTNPNEFWFRIVYGGDLKGR